MNIHSKPHSQALVTATDTMYADILKRLRHGTQTADDADILNQILARLTDIQLHQSCKAITPLNKMRHGINLQACIAFAKRRNQKVYIFLSTHKMRSSARGAARVSALSEAFEMMDNSSLKIPAYLPLTKDMPVALTENTHQALKMVNGAEYTVNAFIPNPDSVVYMVEPGIFIVSGPPEVIL
ncbi:hypothetical protein F4804DRAFT_328016, partial [Jackrogersella minutella]